MFLDFLRAGLPVPDYGRSSVSDVMVVLRGGKPDPDWVRLLGEEERKGAILGLNDLVVLRAATEVDVLALQRVQAVTQGGIAEARAVLARLVERRLLEQESDSARVRLAEPVRRRLRLPRPDRRRIRDDLGEVERAILEHVAAEGRVTRGQVTAAQDLSADQAKRLLASLVRRGLLERRGAGRGAHYEAARKKRAVARSCGPSPISKATPPESGKDTRAAGRHRKGRP